MKYRHIACVIAGVGAVLGPMQPIQAKEVTLSAVSFIRLDIDWGILFKQWVTDVNKTCAGMVKINLRGGPEVMNPFQQPAAVKNGVIDIDFTIPAFFQGSFPGSLAFNLAEVGPAEQRKRGFYDFVNKRLEKSLNARLLLNTAYGVQFHLYMGKKKVEKADLKGLKLRSLPIYRPMFEYMGATAITMNQSELFTALERGAVDGYGYISWGVKEQGWAPVTKYRIDPGFYTVSAVIIMNQGSWGKLSKAGQDCMNKVSVENELAHQALIKTRTPKEYKNQTAAGIETVTLPPAEAKKFLDIAQRIGWLDVKKKAPQDYEALRKLLTK